MNNTKNVTDWAAALALGALLAGAAVAQDEGTGSPNRRIPAGTQVKGQAAAKPVLGGRQCRRHRPAPRSPGTTPAVCPPAPSSMAASRRPARPTSKHPGLVYVRFGTRPLSDPSDAPPSVATAHLVGSNARSEKAR